MRIGICGGTFDPFHRGHLDPILAACEPMQWERVIYIPAHVQPFKQDRETASGYHRFAMAVLATESDSRLFVSPRELERGAISYTVDTLQQLRSEYPDATLDWIIGDDNVAQLDEWREVERIYELGNFVVLARTGSSSMQALPASMSHRVTDPHRRSTHGSIVFAENSVVPVSSTEVRLRVRDGQPIEHLVGARVSRYIQHYGLYRKGQS